MLNNILGMLVLSWEADGVKHSKGLLQRCESFEIFVNSEVVVAAVYSLITDGWDLLEVSLLTLLRQLLFLNFGNK